MEHQSGWERQAGRCGKFQILRKGVNHRWTRMSKEVFTEGNEGNEGEEKQPQMDRFKTPNANIQPPEKLQTPKIQSR
jgi:hypothetical protein